MKMTFWSRCIQHRLNHSRTRSARTKKNPANQPGLQEVVDARAQRIYKGEPPAWTDDDAVSLKLFLAADSIPERLLPAAPFRDVARTTHL